MPDPTTSGDGPPETETAAADAPSSTRSAPAAAWSRPFEPANTVSIRSGAWSERVVEPLARAIGEALLDERPDLERYSLEVAALCRHEARIALLDHDLKTRGMYDKRGKLRDGSLRHLAQFERQAAASRRELGLTPAGEARLRRDQAVTASVVANLDDIVAAGRATVEREALSGPQSAAIPHAGLLRRRRARGLVSDALNLLRGLVLDDRDRRWGRVAAPFQVDDATAVLDVDPGAPRLHFITRPRGGSKTTDAAGITLAAMLVQLPPLSRCYAAAADADQARLLIDAVHRHAIRTPTLKAALRLEASKITTPNGATLEALPADGPGAYGLTPAFVVVDELAQWPSSRGARELWTALVSAVPKVPGARLLVITSAGDPAHWSARIRDRAARSRRWRLSETPGPLPWIGSADLEEQRSLLMPSEYARLHLNEWTTAEDRLTTREGIESCVALDGPQEPVDGESYAIGLDVGLVGDRTVAVVGHLERPAVTRWAGLEPEQPLGAVMVVDRLQVWQGNRKRPVNLGEVEDWIRHAAGHYRGARVVTDPWQTIGLGQRLRAAGINVDEYPFTGASISRLAQTLYRLIRDRALRLPRDEELLDELAHVRLRETSPGVYRMDHDAGRHDDRAIALALAAQHLLASPADIGATVRRYRLVDRVRGSSRSDPFEAIFREQVRRGDRAAVEINRRERAREAAAGPWAGRR